MKAFISCLLLLLVVVCVVEGQGKPNLVTYWASWNPSIQPYSPRLINVPNIYNVIDVAFGVFDYTGNVTIESLANVAQFRQDMKTMQANGKKIILSIGGETCDWSRVDQNMNTIVKNIASLVSSFGFDGIDLDDEQVNDIPSENTLINLVKKLRLALPKGAIITLTPQDVYIFNVAARDSGGWNTYENVLDAVGSIIDWVQIMAYNNGNSAQQDYITWATGFSNPVVTWNGFPSSKLVLGFLSAQNAGSSGYMSSAQAKGVIKALKTSYDKSASDFFGGFMTWDANADQGGQWSTAVGQCVLSINNC